MFLVGFFMRHVAKWIFHVLHDSEFVTVFLIGLSYERPYLVLDPTPS